MRLAYRVCVRVSVCVCVWGIECFWWICTRFVMIVSIIRAGFVEWWQFASCQVAAIDCSCIDRLCIWLFDADPRIPNQWRARLRCAIIYCYRWNVYIGIFEATRFSRFVLVVMVVLWAITKAIDMCALICSDWCSALGSLGCFFIGSMHRFSLCLLAAGCCVDSLFRFGLRYLRFTLSGVVSISLDVDCEANAELYIGWVCFENWFLRNENK